LWPSPQRRRRRRTRRISLLLPSTPHVPFDICYTEEEWEELKVKEKKIEETGVSGSKGPSLWLDHLAWSLRPPKPESLALLTMILQENIILTMFFSEIIMVMSMQICWSL
jgi:hypothetical protein